MDDQQTPSETPELPDQPAVEEHPIQEATFGAGCFWCIEAVFNQIQGVIKAESGYCNGRHPSPRYEEVCSGSTGHAEVVRVQFDARVVTYEKLLEVLFAIHDPTTLNRQGNDAGTQYRSGIYAHNEKQLKAAQDFIQHLTDQNTFGKPIVTEVKPVSNYHVAEDYHQRYFEQNPNQGYCAFVVGPKVAKFQKTFASLLKP